MEWLFMQHHNTLIFLKTSKYVESFTYVTKSENQMLFDWTMIKVEVVIYIYIYILPIFRCLLFNGSGVMFFFRYHVHTRTMVIFSLLKGKILWAPIFSFCLFKSFKAWISGLNSMQSHETHAEALVSLNGCI